MAFAKLTDLLQGDNSEEAFAELVHHHAANGVSGVLPKFLDAQEEAQLQAKGVDQQFGQHQKAALLTRRHIIKGSSGRLPFAALNEHLCMQVLGKVLPSKKTEVSRDGTLSSERKQTNKVHNTL